MNTTTETEIKLPESKLVKHQVKTFRKDYTENGEPFTIIAEVRYDDKCGNGHNSFSITGEIREGGWFDCGGCIHEEIAKHFPELLPFIKWHLTSTDEPLHYVANAVYWAGHSGYMDGKQNSPPNLEHLKSTIVYGCLPDDKDFDLAAHIYSEHKGSPWNDESAARLKGWLKSRLERMMVEFKKDVESLGFTY